MTVQTTNNANAGNGEHCLFPILRKNEKTSPQRQAPLNSQTVKEETPRFLLTHSLDFCFLLPTSCRRAAQRLRLEAPPEQREEANPLPPLALPSHTRTLHPGLPSNQTFHHTSCFSPFKISMARAYLYLHDVTARFFFFSEPRRL